MLAKTVAGIPSILRFHVVRYSSVDFRSPIIRWAWHARGQHLSHCKGCGGGRYGYGEHKEYLFGSIDAQFRCHNLTTWHSTLNRSEVSQNTYSFLPLLAHLPAGAKQLARQSPVYRYNNGCWCSRCIVY